MSQIAAVSRANLPRSGYGSVANDLGVSPFSKHYGVVAVRGYPCATACSLTAAMNEPLPSAYACCEAKSPPSYLEERCRLRLSYSQGYLRAITKEIPKCKRLEFVVSASHYEMHMMCVWPRFRFLEVRTNRIVLVRDMHVAKHGEWRDVPIKRV
jgi:hypothetical protein